MKRLPLLVFLAFLALYAATLLPDVLPEDSGEFQFVAATAGVAHSPGYPLYTMLGWTLARLPVGPNPAWRVNAFSAITAAATVALVFESGRRISGSTWGGLAAALTLGSATTFWATATKASIRPLTAFFTALCLHALIRHRQQAAADGPDPTLPAASARRNDRHLIVFAAALSLGLTHHISLGFPAVVFLIYALLIDPQLIRRPRRWLKPLTAFVLGLSVLLYLPLRGAAEAPLAPPNLDTLPGFIEHFLGLGFRGDMFALDLLQRLAILPTLLRFQFNGVLLLAAVTGALVLLWRDRKLALLLAGSFVVHTAVNLTYDAPQTVEYEMPAYVALALLVAVPCGEIANFGSRMVNHTSQATGRYSRRPAAPPTTLIARPLALSVILIAGVLNLTAHWPSYRALSRSDDTRAVAEALLRDAPTDAVILSNWHWAMPLRYLQEVEGKRTDVLVKYVAPRGYSLAQNWVDAIQTYAAERPVVAVRYFEQAYRDLPCRFEPLGDAFLVRTAPRSSVPAGMTPLDATLGNQVTLLGYRLEREEAQPAQPLLLSLAWSPVVTPTSDLSLFAQVIGSDGRLWSAARDVYHSAGRLAAGEVVIERFTIYPLLHAPPGDYALLVGAYQAGGLRLTAADGADGVQLTTIRLQPSTRRPVSNHPRLVRFAGGPTLIGADYDGGVAGQVRLYIHWAGPGAGADLEILDRGGTVLGRSVVPSLGGGQYATTALDLAAAPARVALLDGDHPRRRNFSFAASAPLPTPNEEERYVPFGDALVLAGVERPTGTLEPGSDVILGLDCLGTRPIERDYIISTSLTGLNADGTWAWRDSHDIVPALGGIPTLKWISGSAVYDPHHLTIPAETPTVPVAGSLVVYDHFTQATLPPLDERLGPSVALGTWTTTSQSSLIP